MNRYREKKITRLHIILFFLVVIVAVTTVIIVKTKYDNRYNKYLEYEQKIENAGPTYLLIKDIKVKEGYQEKIDISNLYELGLINEKINESCEGYLLVNYEKNIENNNYEYFFNAYIKCGNKYKTDNYNLY